MLEKGQELIGKVNEQVNLKKLINDQIPMPINIDDISIQSG